MTGRDDYLPIMADCERALGRLDRALALVREGSTAHLDRATQIELRIVESGIRRDQGLSDAAVLALQVPELTSGRLRPWSARLFYAYADALLAAGRADEARDAFARAAEADPDGETDAADRLDQLDGIEFDDLEDDDLEGDLDDDGLDSEREDEGLDDADPDGDLQDVDLKHDDHEDDNAEGDDLDGGVVGENEADEDEEDDTGESTPTASRPS
jgi:tetratricopeptide (TPR) repeat protein